MVLKNTASQGDVVSFRVCEQDYCIDIAVVREIRGWSPATVLPHAPAHVTGVINLRGAVVAVVDLAARLGLGRTEPTARHVVIIVTLGHQTVGLLADVVSDILNVESATAQPVPDILADSTRALITSVITLEDGRMLRKLHLSEVLPERSSEAA